MITTDTQGLTAGNADSNQRWSDTCVPCDACGQGRLAAWLVVQEFLAYIAHQGRHAPARKAGLSRRRARALHAASDPNHVHRIGALLNEIGAKVPMHR